MFLCTLQLILHIKQSKYQSCHLIAHILTNYFFLKNAWPTKNVVLQLAISWTP